MSFIGYARVSSEDQNLDLQLDALRAAGCTTIYEDKTPGAQSERTGLAKAIARCQSGDTLIVWKLDRLGRSLRHLVNMEEEFRERGIGLKVLTGQGAEIDTAHPSGRMIFGIFAVLAEFERELNRARTKAGMEAAKRRGQHVGRPRKLKPKQLARARSIIDGGSLTQAAVAAWLKVDVATLRRALRAASPDAAR